MTSFDQHVAEMQAMDHDLFIGRLCWYSISGVQIDHATLTRNLLAVGLDKHLPPVPRGSDIFKRVSTAAQRRRVETPVEGVVENYLVREVGKDRGNIWRRIVVERVDTQGRKLGYVETHELNYERRGGSIKVDALAGTGVYPVADQMAEEIRREYNRWANALNSYAVREHIRAILSRLNATAVRPSGGVYFVREDHGDQVDAIETLVNGLPGDCTFHSLPLVDNGKQRAMIKQAFEDESIGAIDALLGEIAKIKHDGKKITSERYAQFASEYTFLRTKVADYSDLLDEALEATASRLEIFSQAMAELMDNVKV